MLKPPSSQPPQGIRIESKQDEMLNYIYAILPRNAIVRPTLSRSGDRKTDEKCSERLKNL